MAAITEKALEDFVCRHPEHVLWKGVEIVGRQVCLEHGRLDILAWDGKRTLVIELKAHSLKEKDIGQILRYTHDVTVTLQRRGLIDNPVPLSTVSRNLSVSEKLFDRAWDFYHGMGYGENERAIIPILIGSDAEKKVRAAAEGANIPVYIWNHDEKRNTLTFEHSEIIGWGIDADSDKIPSWAQQIGRRIQQACDNDMAYILSDIEITPENWRSIPWHNWSEK